MKLIKTSDTAIIAARKVIEQGGIVAFPTETFYGLGVKYDEPGALKRLYEIKQRTREKAMPLIIGEIKTLGLITPAVLNTAKKLMDRFWPGPLTILFDAGKDLSEFITAGTGKAAVRIPGDSFALELAKSLEFPVTATSANISGMPPADNPDDVIGYFGDGVDLVIDGGKSTGGEPSTIVDVTGEGIIILRPGAISSKALYRYLSGP